MAILALVKAWLMLWVSAVEDEDRSLGSKRIDFTFCFPVQRLYVLDFEISEKAC